MHKLLGKNQNKPLLFFSVMYKDISKNVLCHYRIDTELVIRTVDLEFNVQVK